MSALATDRNTATREGVIHVWSVAASVTLYAGALACLNSSGHLTPGATATGLVAVGRVERQVSNGVVAGALNAEVRTGVFRWANSAAADAITIAEIGDLCYVVDDQTVAKTSDSGARSPAGVIDDVDSDGVWVRMGEQALIAPAGAMLAASNLSDLAAVATARGNLGGGANKIVLTMDPVSTKGADAAVVRVVSPVAGAITKVYSVLNAALAAGNATLTGKIGAVAITNGVLALTQAGSAAGDVDVATPSAAHTVAVGDVISFTGGGDSTATGTASISLLITPSA